MLRADEQETPRILCQIFQRICDEEDTPDDWKTGTIMKLRKKGDLGNCSKWGHNLVINDMQDFQPHNPKEYINNY